MKKLNYIQHLNINGGIRENAAYMKYKLRIVSEKNHSNLLKEIDHTRSELPKVGETFDYNTGPYKLHLKVLKVLQLEEPVVVATQVRYKMNQHHQTMHKK